MQTFDEFLTAEMEAPVTVTNPKTFERSRQTGSGVSLRAK